LTIHLYSNASMNKAHRLTGLLYPPAMHEIAQPLGIDSASGRRQFAGALAVRHVTLLTCSLALALFSACADIPDFYAPASEQQRALAAGETTSVALTKAAIQRIEQLDRSGPTLNSVIAIDPDAVTAAERLDSERRVGRALDRSLPRPLHRPASSTR
jgi:hypothetical protein